MTSVERGNANSFDGHRIRQMLWDEYGSHGLLQQPFAQFDPRGAFRRGSARATEWR